MYAHVPREQNNAVSGVLNFGRNIGGSLGIALATTQLARHAQVHQTYLAAHTNNYNPTFVAQLQGIARALEHAGTSAPDAARQALAIAYRQLQGQATQLAYVDALRTVAIIAACMLPVTWIAKGAKQQGGGAG